MQNAQPKDTLLPKPVDRRSGNLLGWKQHRSRDCAAEADTLTLTAIRCLTTASAEANIAVIACSRLCDRRANAGSQQSWEHLCQGSITGQPKLTCNQHLAFDTPCPLKPEPARNTAAALSAPEAASGNRHLKITATLMTLSPVQRMPKHSFGQADQIAPTKQPCRNMADPRRVLQATDRHLCLEINRYTAPDNPEQNWG